MSRLVTIVGATGTQGGSVVHALLNIHGYKLRAITRNSNSDNAKALHAQGVDIATADLNDIESLKTAFTGSYAVYAITNFFEALPTVGKERAMEIETFQGTNLAKAAAATTGLEHYIWSTLPDSRKNSRGKIMVPYYQSKASVDEYIKSQPDLLRKTTFLWVPWYAQNMNYPWYKPFAVPDSWVPDTLFQLQTTSPSTPWVSAGDVTVNIGLFVKAILEQPQKTLGGAYVLASTDYMTAAEVVEKYAALQGKKGRILQVEVETYIGMWPPFTELMHLSHCYLELMKGKGFSSSGEDTILTKDDLQISGLVGSVRYWEQMQ